MYTKITYDLGDTLDHGYHHAGMYGAKGEKRVPRAKPTPEQVIYQNRMNRARDIRRLIKANYTTSDWFVTLTYRKGCRKKMKGVKGDLKKFLDAIRAVYKKRGQQLKFIYCIEIGSRGGIHIHITMNDTDKFNRLLQLFWKHGHPNMKNLYEEGDFRELSEYMAGLPKDGKEGIQPLDKERYAYNRSRNFVVPQPVRKKYLHWTMRTVIGKNGLPKPTPGYYIDKESIRQGVNRFTGLSYLYYSEHRINTLYGRHYTDTGGTGG